MAHEAQKRLEAIKTETLIYNVVPGGGSRKYQAEMMCHLAKNGGLLGMNIQVFAKFIGVDDLTVSTWLNRHPEFRQAWDEGRELADMDVTRTAYQKATGQYEHTETVLDREGKPVTFKRKLEPSDAMIRMWLQHRQGWSERTRSESTNLTVNIDASSPEKAKDAYYALMRQDSKPVEDKS